MNQLWFEMQDLKKRKLNNSVYFIISKTTNLVVFEKLNFWQITTRTSFMIHTITLIKLPEKSFQELTHSTQMFESEAYNLLFDAFKLIPDGSAITLAFKESETGSCQLIVKTISRDKPNPIGTECIAEPQLLLIDKEFMERIYQYITANIDKEGLIIDDLAHEFAISRSQLFRKLKGLTGYTPAQLIRNFRLDFAYQLLQADNTKRVSEAMFAVGFNNAKHFGQIFKQRIGMSPQSVKKVIVIL